MVICFLVPWISTVQNHIHCIKLVRRFKKLKRGNSGQRRGDVGFQVLSAPSPPLGLRNTLNTNRETIPSLLEEPSWSHKPIMWVRFMVRTVSYRNCYGEWGQGKILRIHYVTHNSLTSSCSSFLGIPISISLVWLCRIFSPHTFFATWITFCVCGNCML